MAGETRLRLRIIWRRGTSPVKMQAFAYFYPSPCLVCLLQHSNNTIRLTCPIGARSRLILWCLGAAVLPGRFDDHVGLRRNDPADGGVVDQVELDNMALLFDFLEVTTT